MSQTTTDRVAQAIAAYRPRRFSPAEWELACRPVRDAVTAVAPASPGAARLYLTALSVHLARPSVWDRTGVPDLTVLLTAERIEAAAADPRSGTDRTRAQRAESLQTVARAVGAIQPQVRARATVDLTPTGATRTFPRQLVEAHRDTAAEVAYAIDAYTPRSLPAAAWELVAGDVRALVAAAAPATRQAARVLASTLTSFLADNCVWDQTGRPDLATLLRPAVIVEHVTRTRFTGDNSRSNRHKFLIQLGRAAGTIPVDPPRRRRHIRVDPFLAAGVVRPIPVATLAAARALTQTDRPVINLDQIAGEITRVRDLNPAPGAQVWTEATLTTLAGSALTSCSTSPGRTIPGETSASAGTGGSHVETPMAATPGRRKRLSRRAALAAAAQAHQRAQENQAAVVDGGASRLPDPAVVDPAVRAAVEAFVPNLSRRTAWAANRDLAIRLVYAYRPKNPRHACNIASHLTHYLSWAAVREGRDPSDPLELPGLLDSDQVEAFLDASAWGDASRATARSVLRRVARNLRPHAAPVRLAHAKPGAPYTGTECAELVRLAWHQPTLARQRRLAFIVGFGLGAGLDAVDLRHLTAAHLETIRVAGRDILVVHVPGQGPRARTVPVRDAYASLVRRALEGHTAAGLGASDLLVASCPTAVNVATPTLDRVVAADRTVHRITTARLRHTWLVAAMCAPVPMADLMQAAGIRSARTLSELLEHCPAPDPAQVQATYDTLTALASRTGGLS
jgi:hypothetical protein